MTYRTLFNGEQQGTRLFQVVPIDEDDRHQEMGKLNQIKVSITRGTGVWPEEPIGRSFALDLITYEDITIPNNGDHHFTLRPGLEISVGDRAGLSLLVCPSPNAGNLLGLRVNTERLSCDSRPTEIRVRIKTGAETVIIKNGSVIAQLVFARERTNEIDIDPLVEEYMNEYADLGATGQVEPSESSLPNDETDWTKIRKQLGDKKVSIQAARHDGYCREEMREEATMRLSRIAAERSARELYAHKQAGNHEYSYNDILSLLLTWKFARNISRKT